MEQRRPEQSGNPRAWHQPYDLAATTPDELEPFVPGREEILQASRPAAHGSVSESRRRIPDSDDSSADRLVVVGARSSPESSCGTA